MIKLHEFSTRDSFDIAKPELGEEALVLIKETQEIYHNEVCYSIPEKYKNKITTLEQAVELINSGMIKQVTGELAIKVTEGQTPQVSLKIDSTPGNVDLTQTESGLKANFTEKVTGVKSGDMILKLEGTELQTEIKFSYDEENRKIELRGIDNRLIGEVDCKKFLIDGMLEDVEYSRETHKITYTFNVDAGSKVIEIDLTDLVNLYDGSNIILKSIIISDTEYNEPTANDSVDEAISALASGHRINKKAIEDTKADLTAETTRAKGREDEIEGQVTAEKTRAEAAEKANADKIEALEGKVGETSVEDQITDALDDLDYNDTPEDGKFVTKVSQTDGKITVERDGVSADKVVADTVGEGSATNVQGVLQELNDSIDNLDGEVVKKVTINGVDAEVENNEATVEIDGNEVKLNKEGTGETINEDGTILDTDSVSDAIEAIEKGILDDKAIVPYPEENQIVYTTTDGEAIKLGVNGNISSNIYYKDKGFGIITFNNNTSLFLGNQITLETIKYGSPLQCESGNLSYCSNLKYVELPEGLEIISNSKFFQCFKLERVNIPSTVTKIDIQAFSQCVSLKNINFSPNLKIIDKNAFSGCISLTSVDLSNVNTIGIDAFNGCNSLVYTRLKHDITELPNGTFNSCSFTYIYLPPTIKSIGESCFRSCTSLTSINIPSGVSILKDHMFAYCYDLREIVIPDTVISVGNQTFLSVNNVQKIDSSMSKIENFPNSSKLETLILRSNTLVEDVDTYVSTFTLEEGQEVPEGYIQSRTNLDQYIGTPNNWLKIYVPYNLLKAYQERYPTLKSHLHPITGEDIYAIKEDVDSKLNEVKDNYLPLAGGTMTNTDLVENLNAEMVGGYTVKDLTPYHYDLGESIIIETKDISQRNIYNFVIRIFGDSYNPPEPRKPIDTIIQISCGITNKEDFSTFYLGSEGVIHKGHDIGDVHVFGYNGRLCIHLSSKGSLSQRIWATALNQYSDGTNYIERIYSGKVPEGAVKLRTIKPLIGVNNYTGSTFDHVDLPATVTSLDTSTLPPIANVSTIILRYNGVVKDLDTYMTSSPITLEGLIEHGVLDSTTSKEDLVEIGAMSEDSDEISKEGLEIIRQVLESRSMLDGDITPLANLDAYVGTPNNWLKIYVPKNQLEDYRKTYPNLYSQFNAISVTSPYDNLVVGGRNLFKNSKTFKDWERSDPDRVSFTSKKDEDFTVATIDATGVPYYTSIGQTVPIKKGVPFTVSFLAKSEQFELILFPRLTPSGPSVDGGSIDIRIINNLDSDLLSAKNIAKFYNQPDVWKHYQVSFICNADCYIYFTFRVIKDTITSFCAPKLEIGTISTDWSPAPEDIDTEIDNIKEQIKNKFYSIDFISGNIVQEFTSDQSIKILEFNTQNIESIVVTAGADIQKQELQKELVLPANTLVTWEISKTSEDLPALIGIKFVYNEN